MTKANLEIWVARTPEGYRLFTNKESTLNWLRQVIDEEQIKCECEELEVYYETETRGDYRFYNNDFEEERWFSFNRENVYE